MEYLTIEEKASLTGYLVLLDDKIKTCKLLGIPSGHWEHQQQIAKIAIDKISKTPSLEVIEMRKTYQNTEPCKH